MSEVIIEILASNPPSILIALAFVLIIVGNTMNDSGLTLAGWVFFVFGIILQVLWLFLRR